MSNSFIWPIDKTLPSATPLGPSGPGNNGYEGVLCILQLYWSLTIRLFSVISRTFVSGSAEMQLVLLYTLIQIQAET